VLSDYIALACGTTFVALLVVLAVRVLVGATRNLSRHQAVSHQAEGVRERERCPRCGALCAGAAPRCWVCHWPEAQLSDRTAAAIEALRLQAGKFHKLGLISTAQRSRLEEFFAQEQSTLPAESPATPHAAGGDDQPVPEPTADEIVPSEAVEIVDEPPPVEQTAAVTASTEDAQPTESTEEDAARRAERYAEKRAAAAAADAQEAAPPAEKKPFSRLLAAFLEENNIRWGEMVGGLLIICCSIALVISFWADIANRPWLKFGLFGGVTAALFGCGIFIERRWRLPNTSHGVLVIATLLVPLNFLAIAAFTAAPRPVELLTIAGELASIAIFSALIYASGHIITAGLPWLLAAAVMVPSVMQLLVRRFVMPDSSLATLYAMASVTLLCYFVTSVGGLRRALPREGIDTHVLNRIFKLLGMASFAVLPPLGLMLVKTETPVGTAHDLAPLIALVGAPALWIGVVLWRVLGREDLAGPRTAATFLAVTGGSIMVAGVWLAWPNPALLVCAAVVDFVILTLLAFAFRRPAAHLPAALLLAAGWVITGHVASGNFGWLDEDAARVSRALLSTATGTFLTLLLIPLGAALAALRFRSRFAEARWYAVAAAVAALLSLALVSWFGFGVPGDPGGATWIYAVYAAGAIGAAYGFRSRYAAWAGAVLLLAGLVQGLAFRWIDTWPLRQPWTTALLIHASAAALAATVSWRRGSGKPSLPGPVFERAALITSAVGALLALAMAANHLASLTAGIAYWVAAVWLVLSVVAGFPGLFTAFHAALALAIMATVTAVVSRRDWYAAAEHPWLDPWFLQSQGIAIALCCLISSLLRIFGQRMLPHKTDAESNVTSELVLRLRRYLDPERLAVDHLLAAGTVLLAFALSAYAALPGVAQELALREGTPVAGAKLPRVVPPAGAFALPNVPYPHASGTAGWAMVLAAAAMLLVGLWEKANQPRLLALVLIAACCAPLLASEWHVDVAVASALRWSLAGFLLIGSAPLWFRRLVAKWSASAGWQMRRADREETAKHAIGLLLTLVFGSLLLMGAYVGGQAFRMAKIDPATAQLLFTFGLLAMVVLAIAVALTKLWPLAASTGAAEQRERDEQKRAASPRSLAVNVLLVLGMAPLVVLVVFIVAAALKRHPVVGPQPGSWFLEIGLAVSYAVPLLVMAVALIGHALRERSARLAFAGGLLLSIATTAGYLLEIAKQGAVLDAIAWLRVGQINAIVTSTYALCWLAVLYAGRRTSRRRPAASLLMTQVALGPAIMALTIVPGIVALIAQPTRLAFPRETAHGYGWLGLLLALAATSCLRGKQTVQASFLGPAILGAASLIALTTCHLDPGSWLAYHTLMAMYLLSAWSMLGWQIIRRPGAAWTDGTVPGRMSNAWKAMLAAVGDGAARGSAAWPVGIGMLVVGLALRGLGDDPAHPWWSLAALVIVMLLLAACTLASPRRRWLALAAGLGNLAASIWWVEQGYRRTGTSADFLEFLLVNAASLALSTVAFVPLHLRIVAPVKDARGGSRIFGVHRAAAALALSIVLCIAAWCVSGDLHGDPADPHPAVAWTALLLTGMAVLACLWDAATRYALASLYLLGLAGIALSIAGFDLDSELLLWMLTILAAAYALGTSYLWSRRQGLQSLADRLHIPHRLDAPLAGHRWLLAANLLMATAVTCSAVWIELAYADFSQRMLAAYAVLAQALAIGLLARGQRRSPLQYAALAVGVVGAVMFAWAWIPPGLAAPILHRAALVAVALAFMIAVYGLGLVKLLRKENEWTRAAQRLVPWLIGCAAVAVTFVLAVEAVLFYTRHEVAIQPWAWVIVAATLLGLTAAALAAALLPGRDPLNLPERRRAIYVYAAEGLLALLFLHVRVTMPWLFQEAFRRYWPLNVMLIAFAGVGFSEWMRRRRQHVLSEPLERTGAFLPLLPVLAFWIVPVQVHYSLLLLAAGMLYALLSITRRSFGFGVVAALAANGSLWYLLFRAEGMGLLEHPQLWIIPPALCLLAAAYANRRELSEARMSAIRYAAATLIYVASTADIFISGVAQAPWLPLVLAGFSLAGIFAGIMLRVRAFLYLGTSFLLLALLTIIWYAAVDLEQTWLWWASGIVTGILIIVLFAVIEKKRHEVLQAVEQLKHWKA